ncbi:MAG: 30S ribosomal protein S8 [Candidatus Eremiobacteraeota bacterium]|nr:30S ribosomal protein S8 [Candidatus Eremiobacteraeota bacterium]
MAMTDPIADMFTRIRNANTAFHEQVDIPASKMKERLAKIFKEEGFINDFQVINTGNSQGIIRIKMKYGPNRQKIISGIRRISKPGLRVYVGKSQVPRIFGGLGVVILSTPGGLMTGKQAQHKGVGGEVLGYVW